MPAKRYANLMVVQQWDTMQMLQVSSTHAVCAKQAQLQCQQPSFTHGMSEGSANHKAIFCYGLLNYKHGTDS